MNLLIAEKPSVAVGAYKELLEKIENESFVKKDGYLQGKNWCISWCVGHLVGLEMPDAYGWKDWTKETLPMIPQKWQYQVLPGTKKQYQILAKLITEANLVVNGGDAGREGELIVRLVLKKSQNEKKILKRLWVNSFVFEDMKKAWSNLKSGSDYENLYRAALCRSIGDWLVGLNSTRAYSLATGVRGLSVGRVQTPTLALIVGRDNEVENWKNKFYHQLQADWKNITFTYFKDDENKFDRTENLESIKSTCTGQNGVLISQIKEEKKVNPPKPFDLAELQKAANVQLGFKASETLELTQKLYEKKYVTYPRTDSEFLPETMLDEAFEILYKLTDSSTRQHLKTKNEKMAFFNSKKVTDHYAIIPTGLLPQGLTGNEEKLYELIKSRFVTAFGKTYVYDLTQLVIDVVGHQFKASVKKEKEKGFKQLLKNTTEDEEQILAIDLKENETAPITSLEVVKKEVTKPTYYTEATLLGAMGLAGKSIEDEELKQAMKEKGLGTAATRASIIETLKKREYIFEKGKSIISTQKGRELIAMVDTKVSSPELTGEWEYKLAQMEKGNYDGGMFLKEINTFVTQIVAEAEGKSTTFKEHIKTAQYECPKCKNHLLTKNSYGYFCQESCGFKLFQKMFNRNISEQHLLDLIQKGKTDTIKGFKNKDQVKFDAPLKFNEAFEVIFDFVAANNDESLKRTCPKCKNKTVQLKPKGAFCCSDGCNFVIWRVIAQKSITDKDIYLLLENGTTKKIGGFKSTKGKSFNAVLKLKEDFSGVDFKF
ncbi:MAG: DNA topoisomerase 3 [Flavobacteriales bacterium]|nr:DNA topoisomerase 3 [Flavobacteriales bacterium]